MQPWEVRAVTAGRGNVMGCEVLIVHASAGWGGAERTTVNIARALSQEWGVCVCSNDRRFHDELPSGVTVVPFASWFGRWAEIAADLLRLARLVRALRPRLVLGMMPYAAFLSSVVKGKSVSGYLFVASPRGSCLSFLRHFVHTRREAIRYRLFF